MRRAVAAAVGLAVLIVSTAAAQQTGVGADIELLQRADAARSITTPTANVTIEEFVDFACSHCANFHRQRADSLQALVEAENLNLTIRMFPIPRLMRGFQAAEAAFCAAAHMGRLGFMGMLKQLFENQSAWSQTLDPTPIFETYARNIGAPLEAYRDCVARDAMAPLIVNDVRIAKDLNVRGTPTFVFNKPGEMVGDEQFYSPESMAPFLESIERVRNR
ncbi:MAG: thioredoxin domain-containing protein [Gemmatimonadales bacterium]|jgi:protein-disulfide isomerase